MKKNTRIKLASDRRALADTPGYEDLEKYRTYLTKLRNDADDFLDILEKDIADLQNSMMEYTEFMKDYERNQEIFEDLEAGQETEELLVDLYFDITNAEGALKDIVKNLNKEINKF